MGWICGQRLTQNLCQICANTLVLINNIQKWDSNVFFFCKTSILMRGYLKRWNCSGSMSACCTVVGCSGSTATCGIRDSLAGSLTSYNKLPTEVGERWPTWGATLYPLPCVTCAATAVMDEGVSCASSWSFWDVNAPFDCLCFRLILLFVQIQTHFLRPYLLIVAMGIVLVKLSGI